MTPVPDPLQLGCPHCSALNRLPPARLAERPNCGRCHRALLVGHPLDLDQPAFELHGERSGLPLLLDFWADWCGPCRSMAPQFDSAAAQLEPLMRLARVDTEAQPRIAARFAIRSLPTLVLLQQGRELARQAGAQSTAAIVQWARGALQRG